MESQALSLLGGIFGLKVCNLHVNVSVDMTQCMNFMSITAIVKGGVLC